MTDTASLIQGTDEWKAARLGSLGASRVHEAIAKTKSGWGASRANVMAAIITERLTGIPHETYQNAAMIHGIETESEARDAYAFRSNADVRTAGLYRHPTICWTHASPDGLVGENGLVEIKCPTSATHLDTLLGAGLPAKYVTQMQWQMACTGRAWCDFVSYDPRMPEAMRLYVKRVTRDKTVIAGLERDIVCFLAELDEKVIALRSRYGAPQVDLGYGVDKGGLAVHPIMAG